MREFDVVDEASHEGPEAAGMEGNLIAGSVFGFSIEKKSESFMQIRKKTLRYPVL